MAVSFTDTLIAPWLAVLLLVPVTLGVGMHGTGTGEQDCDLWGAIAAATGWTDCASSRANTVFPMQVI